MQKMTFVLFWTPSPLRKFHFSPYIPKSTIFLTTPPPLWDNVTNFAVFLKSFLTHILIVGMEKTYQSLLFKIKMLQALQNHIETISGSFQQLVKLSQSASNSTQIREGEKLIRYAEGSFSFFCKHKTTRQLKLLNFLLMGLRLPKKP